MKHLEIILRGDDDTIAVNDGGDIVVPDDASDDSTDQWTDSGLKE